MSLYDLKQDMLRLIELSAEIEKYNQLLLFHNNLKDKRNYNPQLCEKITEKKNECQTIFFALKHKWFD